MNKLFGALLTATTLTVSISTASASNKDYVLNTASTGGTYHPVGTAISTLSKVNCLRKNLV